jgi:sugar fermentation stimulation protein A
MKTDISGCSELSTTGAYVLFLRVSEETVLNVGGLGTQKFPKGYYTYTGSALGNGSTNLKHRLARHQRKQKRLFWHIDYLLANKNVTIENTVAAETTKKLEGTINSHLKTLADTTINVNGFGASDCTNYCKSHLLHFLALNSIDNIVQKLISYLESLPDVSSVVIID